MKSADFSTNFDFSGENPVKSADFSANLPLKIPRNFDFFPAKYQKPCKLIDKVSLGAAGLKVEGPIMKKGSFALEVTMATNHPALLH